MSQRFTHGLLLVIVGLLAANLLQAPTAGVAHAQSMNASEKGVFALVAPGINNGQNVLFVIDPLGRRLAVYDDVAKGQLSLRCVRNLEYELTLESFPKEPKKVKSSRRIQVPSVKYMRDLAKPK